MEEKWCYMDVVRKISDLYEETLGKATLFRIQTDKIFESNPNFKYLKSDSIFKGFFFMFVYKDWIIRDTLFRVKECLPTDK